LIGYATILIPLAFNIFARKTLKPIEIIGAVLHTIFFIVFVVVLICLGGRNSATFVFTEDSGGISGWTNPGAQWCIGLLSAVFPLTAFDGVLHLSKRSKDVIEGRSDFEQATRSRTQRLASHEAW
jgi:choline transport protein